MKNKVLMTALLAGMVSMGANAEVIAVDFNVGGANTYVGAFDGVAAGEFIGYAFQAAVVESPSASIGSGITLSFVDVGGWDNSNGAAGTELSSLGDSQIFSVGLGASDPVAFSLSGFNATDVVTVEVLDRFGDWAAEVTFEGVTTVADTDLFTTVGSGLTGATSYGGTFTGIGGPGVEGNLAGLRVNVVPEPATMGLFGIFGAGILFVRRTFRR